MPHTTTRNTAAMSARHQFALLLVFDTLIALGITAFAENSLFINLVYSHCIGLCIWTLLQIQMLLFIRQRQTQWRRLWLAVPLATTIGYWLGTLMAQQLLAQGGIYTVAYHPQKALGFLVLSLAAGAAITYYFMSRERIALARQATEAALRQATEARLRLLESQLEPHMLFNTLSNLRVLIASDPQRATFMLDRMTAYLRATLSASRASTHALQAEFDRLRDYLELIAIRMGPRLQFTLDLPPDLAQQPVPALLLQPLVENSIQHALEPAIAGGHITVRAQRAGAQLRLTVQDNGAGYNATQPVAGFGIAQVRERLRTLYGDAAQLQFEEVATGGTLARLHFPITP
jgi:sensor histidine kinase YesM